MKAACLVKSSGDSHCDRMKVLRADLDRFQSPIAITASSGYFCTTLATKSPMRFRILVATDRPCDGFTYTDITTYDEPDAFATLAATR